MTRATLLPSELTCNPYAHGDQRIPSLSVSASRTADGRVTITLCHLGPVEETEIECALEGLKPTAVSGRVLTAPAMNAHNTFEEPERVKPEPFTAFSISEGGIKATLPPSSLVVLELR